MAQELTLGLDSKYHGESENNNSFSPRGLSFWANTVLKKNGS